MTTGTPVPRLLYQAILALSLALGGAAFAEESEESADPPELAARLSVLQGDVSVVSGDTGDMDEATLNRPLTGGDEIVVGRGSRAELQLGMAILHLDEGARLALFELDDESVEMRLTGGTMVAHVRSLPDNGEVGIDTSHARVALLAPGEYTVTAQDSRDTTYVAVREGKSEISQGSQVFTLHDLQEGRYSGVSSLVEDLRKLDVRDDFELWANERDSRAERSTSARYVSSRVVGYEDLDDHGYWETSSYYGPVWYPRHVAMGWAPYRFGRWAYIGPWGWSWIDDSPWGFAPFHYGRWAYMRSRWCWVPGPRHVRAVYAPAVVGWSGRGSNVAWFPLGPRERYVPRYRASERYIRHLNDSNTTPVDGRKIDVRNREPQRRFANEHAANAVTAVSQHAFTSGSPVGRNIVRINPREAREVRSTLPTPTRAVVPRNDFGPVNRDHRVQIPRNESRPQVRTPTREVRTLERDVRAPAREVRTLERDVRVPPREVRTPNREVRVPVKEVRAPERAPRVERPAPPPRESSPEPQSRSSPPPLQRRDRDRDTRNRWK